MTGVERIAAERKRQIETEGYGPSHDRGQHDRLALAAATYAIPQNHRGQTLRDVLRPALWPWRQDAYRPSTDRVRELEKAGALIAAAIDSIVAERPPHPFTPGVVPSDEGDRDYRERCHWPEGPRGMLICGKPASVHEARP